MVDDENHLWKRLRPVWIGGLVGLIAGVILFIVAVALPLPDRKALVPVHDIFGGLKLFDIRKLPFLLPVFGLMLGLLVKMYRDAVVKHRRRRTVPPSENDSVRR